MLSWKRPSGTRNGCRWSIGTWPSYPALLCPPCSTKWECTNLVPRLHSGCGQKDRALATRIINAPYLDSMLSTSRLLFSQFLLGAMQANINKGPPSMMASLDHTMWFSNAFHMSDWLLMVVRIHFCLPRSKINPPAMAVHSSWPAFTTVTVSWLQLRYAVALLMTDPRGRPSLQGIQAIELEHCRH